MVGRGGEGNRPPKRTLGDYAYQQGPKHYTNILIPHFSNKVAELKPTLLSLIGSHPFVAMDHEDTFTHLSIFMELCSTKLLTKMMKLSTSDLSHSPRQVRQRRGSNHIQTKASTLRKWWRKNALQGSFLHLDLSVQNLPLLLFPKGLMNLFVKHGRDSKLCCRGAQTIVLMMLQNYISSTVV